MTEIDFLSLREDAEGVAMSLDQIVAEIDIIKDNLVHLAETIVSIRGRELLKDAEDTQEEQL